MVGNNYDGRSLDEQIKLEKKKEEKMRPMILLFGSQILLIQDLQGFVNSKTVGFPRFEPTIELTNIGLSSLISYF